MAPINELERFRTVWDMEAHFTTQLLKSLPTDQYDFRPDPKGRSIGELAWHLSEIDACLSFGIAEHRFRLEDEPPNLKRPREIKLLAPGFRRIHEEAAARLANLRSEQLDESVTYFDGQQLTVRDVLWTQLLHHLIHHRPSQSCTRQQGNNLACRRSRKGASIARIAPDRPCQGHLEHHWGPVERSEDRLNCTRRNGADRNRSYKKSYISQPGYLLLNLRCRSQV